LLHGSNDPLICSAAADVALHASKNLLFAGTRVASQQRHSTHNHPGRAVAALESFVIEKSLLHRVQPAILLKAFNRRDSFSRRRTHRSAAGANWFAIKQYSACPALTFSAAVLGTGKVETVTQNGKQRLVVGNIKLMAAPVYEENDWHGILKASAFEW